MKSTSLPSAPRRLDGRRRAAGSSPHAGVWSGLPQPGAPMLRVRFRDAQCGFKALRADAARQLLPHVLDHAWFFDTELLVLAERAGLRIREVPVRWVDDPDSRVDIVATALEDLRGVRRLLRRRSRPAIDRKPLTVAIPVSLTKEHHR